MFILESGRHDLDNRDFVSQLCQDLDICLSCTAIGSHNLPVVPTKPYSQANVRAVTKWKNIYVR